MVMRMVESDAGPCAFYGERSDEIPAADDPTTRYQLVMEGIDLTPLQGERDASHCFIQMGLDLSAFVPRL